MTVKFVPTNCGEHRRKKKGVAIIAKNRPPMTALPSGRILLAAFSQT
jgi:hypothetical protein